MLFNSAEFLLLFLPITFLVYFGLNHRRLTLAGKTWLILASLFFYGWWNPAYVVLILVSMLANFAIGSGLTRGQGSAAATGSPRPGVPSRKGLLFVGMAFNLGLLGYFKYADFFVANVNSLAGADWALPQVVLPLAISFFTFTQIAYLVDAYRSEAKEYDLLNYVLFVTFFPHLIAGPILHHKEMMPQFASRWSRIRQYPNILLGLFIFSMGLFKKTVIADGFATWATAGFDKAEVLNFFEAWGASLSYTFQLYFDFSGYSDMAIGAALLFNIRLPINFNSPYKALNIQDFWRRWHMTLSRFLRDYVYIPLGGNRRGRLHTHANLFATFLLGGLWHGASWMFVIWGALHGIAIVLHRIWRDWGGRMPTALAWLLTFNFINVTWVFFRARDMDAALKVLGGMVGLNGILLPQALADRSSWLREAGQTWGLQFGQWVSRLDGNYQIFAWLAGALVLSLFFRNSNQLVLDADRRELMNGRWLAWCALLMLVSLTAILASSYTEFIYFNF